jgi:hypothetical protein
MIDKYWLNNIFVHALTEYRTNNLILERAETDETISRGEVETIAKNAYLLFRENNFNNKYVHLENTITGLDMVPDIQIVGASIAGESFYDSVWNPDKNKLPDKYYLYGFLVIGLGIAYTLIGLFLLKNWLRYIAIPIGILATIIGLAVTISLFMGTTYIWFQAIASGISPIIQINNFDQYVRTNLAESEYFYKTEILKFRDASGLTHYVDGQKVPGALEQAGWKFNFIVVPALISLLLLPIWLPILLKLIKKIFAK